MRAAAELQWATLWPARISRSSACPLFVSIQVTKRSHKQSDRSGRAFFCAKPRATRRPFRERKEPIWLRSLDWSGSSSARFCRAHRGLPHSSMRPVTRDLRLRFSIRKSEDNSISNCESRHGVILSNRADGTIKFRAARALPALVLSHPRDEHRVTP